MRRRIAPLFLFATGALLFGSTSSGCGSLNSLVGGECADGYIDCNGNCVDVVNDPVNCGTCDNVCDPSVGCNNGICTGKRDGAFADGNPDGTTDGNGSDGPLTDGSSNDGFSNDGSSNDGSSNDGNGGGDGNGGSDGSVNDGSSNDGNGGGDGSIVDSGIDSCPPPPYDNASNCGACGVVCTLPNDACVAQGPNFICAPTCIAPDKLCFNKCVSVLTDPENCGACGVVCESNLCVAGVCQGTKRGDIVYLGFDYQSIPININIAQARELINSVFLADRTPIRLLAFQKYANATSVSNVTQLLAAAQSATGRTITITTTTDENFVTNNLALSSYDALLVYDQETAPAATMGPIGTAWATKLSTFTNAGGVFITMDGVAGADPQMHTFETNTGLLSVTAHTALANSVAIDVVAPGNAVGVGVTTPYGTRTRSSRFVTEANGGAVTYVSTESSTAQPNVVHKIAP